MGWTSSREWTSPTIVKREILDDYKRQPDHFEVRDTRSTCHGRHFWVLLRVKYPEGHKCAPYIDMIVLYLINGSRSGGEYGYAWKDISEDMGPCEVDCPLSLLDKASPAELVGSYAADWRGRVRAYHAQRKAGVDLHPGDKFRLTFNNRTYTVLDKIKRSYTIRRDDGARFKLPPSQFRYVERLPA